MNKKNPNATCFVDSLSQLLWDLYIVEGTSWILKWLVCHDEKQPLYSAFERILMLADHLYVQAHCSWSVHYVKKWCKDRLKLQYAKAPSQVRSLKELLNHILLPHWNVTSCLPLYSLIFLRDATKRMIWHLLKRPFCSFICFPFYLFLGRHRNPYFINSTFKTTAFMLFCFCFITEVWVRHN